MNKYLLLKLLSFSGLATILTTSLMVFYQQITLSEFQDYALVGTLIWLCTAPFWINKEE